MSMPPPKARFGSWITALIGLVMLAGTAIFYFIYSVSKSEDELFATIAKENDGIEEDSLDELELINFDDEFRQLLSKKPSQEA